MYVLQVRLPSGETVRQRFQPDSTLGDVLAFVINQRPELGGSQLTLVQVCYNYNLVKSL